jgi:RNA polymerase sigma factor (sigma-70 family)
MTRDPMKSKEPTQTQSLRVLLEDPDIRRRARTWAERLVRRYGLAPMTGEDLYQEAMTKLVRYANCEEPREVDYPHAFFFKVLHNQARTILQTKAHSTFGTRHIDEVEYDEVPSQKLSDNFDMVQRIESGILLDEAFRSLDSEQDRHLFNCIVNGFTTRQIALALNVSHVTAANRVTKLIKKIQKSVL